MESILLTAIEAEAKKRIAKHSRKWYYIYKYRRVFTKRTGRRAKGSGSSVPKSWSHHKHFDPRYCLNHSTFLAKGIWASLQAGTYKPVPSFRVDIPKGAGGVRTIDTFSVPDAAVAKIFLENMRTRNAKIFSDSSYAYQNDKSPLDAIIRLQSSLKLDVIFVSQYDFSAYFDSIEHYYIEKLLSKDGPFLTTVMERKLLGAVIRHEYVQGPLHSGTRTCGTPQGHSLSLFLANVAAHPLDEQLGRLNGTFARFADDSVVVNTSYEDALRTAEVYHRFSKSSGIKINPKKSSGIRMFSESSMEMDHISEFDFLGYKFCRSGLYVGDRAIDSIKRRCSRIIYNNLLLHIRRTGAISRKRLGKGFLDWDLVTCVNELRAYIYGGLSQATLDQALSGRSTTKNVAGAVSYFALVENSQIFRELDGWLVDVLDRAYEFRIEEVSKLPSRAIKSIKKDRLIAGTWYKFPAVILETRLPSFFTAWRVARKSWSQHGLGGIDTQGMGYAYL